MYVVRRERRSWFYCVLCSFCLWQVEGPKTPEEMIAILQRVVEDSSPVLVTARVEAEERRTNLRLREEQDAAYRAALEADQVYFPSCCLQDLL